MVLRIGRGELPAGGVAALVFATLVFPLEWNLWLAMALAIATYIGVMLVWPPVADRRASSAGTVDAREHLAYEEALNTAAALRERTTQIARPDVQDRVVRMLDHADRILVAMSEDGNLAAAPVFNEGWLTPLHLAVAKYVRLSGRDVKSARVRADKVETCDLARFEAAVDTFDEELNRSSAIDVAALEDVLESNLGDLDTLAPVEDVPVPLAAVLLEPTDSSAATRSFAPGAAAARNAARLGLTPREHEIVVLLAQRLRNKEMANRLFISVKTVENHVHRILDKLGLESRDDVRDFAVANDLLPPSEPPPPSE